MKPIQDSRVTTVMLFFTCAAVTLITFDWQLHALMGLSIIYLVLIKRYAAAGTYIAAYCLIWGLVLILPPRVGSALVMLYVTLKMLPMFAIGNVLLTTPPNVIMMAGYKMHVSQTLLIMICILFRFSSVLRMEMKAISQGIRARGILPHWYSALAHPAQSYECFVLPLIIRALKLSTELSCAAEFRGVESHVERTCIHRTSIFQLNTVWAAIYVLGGCAILIYGKML